MSTTLSASILDRLLEPVGKNMNVDFARELAELRAAPDVQARLDELAEKCTEGTLSTEERSEYEYYIQAIHVIGILQRKARAVLKNGGPT